MCIRDSTDPVDCKDLQTRLVEEYPIFEQIIYSSGISEEAYIGDLERLPYQRVLSTKIGPLSVSKQPHLSEVYLSSVASLWSQSGGTYYSTANIILDQQAIDRHMQGLNAYSLQLGPFSSGGMAASHANKFHHLGIQPFSIMQLANIYLSATMPLCTFISVDLNILIKAFSLRGTWRFADGITSTESKKVAIQPPSNTVRDDRRGSAGISDIISMTLKEALGVSNEESIDFQEIDSLTAVEISRSLSRMFGIELAATLIYDYPSIEDLERYIGILNGETMTRIDNALEKNINSAGPVEYTLVYGVQEIDLPSFYPDCDCIGSVPRDRWSVEDSKVCCQNM